MSKLKNKEKINSKLEQFQNLILQMKHLSKEIRDISVSTANQLDTYINKGSLLKSKLCVKDSPPKE